MHARLSNKSVFHIDKFAVPTSAKQEFLRKVFEMQELLGNMGGCLQNDVLEQLSGPGEFNIVAIVEWASAEALENARAAVIALHEKTKFNTQEFLSRLGIKADVSKYAKVAA